MQEEEFRSQELQEFRRKKPVRRVVLCKETKNRPPLSEWEAEPRTIRLHTIYVPTAIRTSIPRLLELLQLLTPEFFLL